MEIYKREKTKAGKVIVTENTPENPLSSLKLYGRTEQFSTTGAQLFDFSAYPTFAEHVTYTKDDTSIVIASESVLSSGIYRRVGFDFQVDSSKTYTLSFDTDSTVGIIAGWLGCGKLIDTSGKTHYSITLTNITTSVFSIGVREANQTVKFSNIMISEGTEELPYEPYTGGIPSPNPQYPQELVSVGDDGDVEVGVYGGNLLDYDKWSKVGLNHSSGICEWKDYGIVITAILNDTYTRHTLNPGSIYPLPCSPNTTYTMSWEWSGNFDDRVYVFFNGLIDGNVNVRSNVGSITFTTPDDTTFITFRVGCYDAGTTSTYRNVRINLGDTTLPFEPYHKQSLTALTPNGLPGIKVTDASLANYTDSDGQMWCCDEVDFGRGVYVKRIKNKHYTSENVITNHSNHDLSMAILTLENDAAKGTFGMCDKLKVVDSNTQWENSEDCVAIHLSNGRVFCSFSGCVTALEAKAKLDEIGGVDIQFILATPVETPLTDEELASYKALHTNYPVTTVMNDADAWMEVGYYSARIEARTDWKPGEYFNIEDYNRIKRNLNLIRQKALDARFSLEFEEMGDDKTYQDYSFYADEINRFEANVDHLCAGIFPFDVGERQTFYDNQPFIDWQELNRIESACLTTYRNLDGMAEGRAMLAFTLNGGAF